MSIQISAINNNGTNRVHAAGCADVTKEAKRAKATAWTVAVDSKDALGLALWGDIATDHFAEGTPEHLAEVRDLMTADEILPCVAEAIEALPQTSAPVIAVGITRYSEKEHGLKAQGTIAKTICNSVVKDVRRQGQVAGREFCSRCAKAIEQGATPLTVEQFDWTGETPRLIVSTVEATGEGTELAAAQATPEQAPVVTPVAEESAEEPKAAKKASRKPAAKKETAKDAPKSQGAAKLSATAAELLEFVVLGFERGVLTSSQKSSYKTVTRRLMEARYGEQWETANVFETDLEALDVIFRDKVPGKSEITYKVYKGDFRKALEFFGEYVADKAAWEKSHPAKAAK